MTTIEDREQKGISQIIFDSIDEGVFTTDKECRITSLNRSAERISGFTREEVIGKYCFDIFRTDLCQRGCALRSTLENGKSASNVRVTIIRRDGRKLPVSVSTTLLRDGSDRCVGAVEFFRDLSEIENLQNRISKLRGLENIVSCNEKMQHIFKLLPNIAESECNVVIQGPSGSGKELLAQALHNMSPRKHNAYIRINCAALPETLLESELFGYARGAFTDAKRDKPGMFYLAQGGTLLLDEIGDMPLSLQVKLLRVLNNGEYQPLGSTRMLQADARIITSTNQDIKHMVEQGAFREDLYYRINVISIVVPPLRERLEDLPILIEHFIRKFRGKRKKDIRRVSDGALNLLRKHDFPGNVRELENAIEHAFVICEGNVIEAEHLPQRILEAVQNVENGHNGSFNGNSSEEAIIREALIRNGGNCSRSARELGMHRVTLWRKMSKYGILANNGETAESMPPS
ncbi:MAG: PAS domain-containing protein [Candidatus Abyssobacteria bacterium SURF_5]|uniref:PAS domain-containing protein n=1 Tax=Abyssobacteria bacterium (strain SURF_5) TaxID=2093360 RepID=A0A3A4MUS0_ABYX5|nr:MAG: PAS domain-containing protein [Candidatus Abyssubacteria bacterium SURF_5]